MRVGTHQYDAYGYRHTHAPYALISKNAHLHELPHPLTYARTHARVQLAPMLGSLATAGYGTALGVIRSLWEAGALERAYCTETRPYNQGGCDAHHLLTVDDLISQMHVPVALFVQ